MTSTELDTHDAPTREDRLFAAAGYLAVFVGCGVIGPVVLFVWKRRTSPFVAAHALQATVLAILLIVSVPAWLSIGFVLSRLVDAVVDVGGWPLLIGLVLIVGWNVGAHAVGVLRALGGRPFVVPMIGRWLERRLSLPAV